MITKYIAKPETKESLSLNLVSAFCTMIATVQDGNQKWTLHEILESWMVAEVGKCKDTYHLMVRLKSYLYAKGCSCYKVKLSRNFVPIHKKIMAQDFEELSLSEVFTIDSNISKYTGFNFKSKPVGEYNVKEKEENQEININKK